MELFVIHCTTCRARLKVHDPALVGDIVECPKCGSFVQVTAPAGWQPPAPSSLPAAALAAVPPLIAPASASTSSTNLTSQTPRTKGTAALSQAVPIQAAPKQTACGQASAALSVPPPLPAQAAAVSDRTVSACGKGTAVGKGTASGSSLIVPEPPGDAALTRLLSPIGEHWQIFVGGIAGVVVVGAVAWLALGLRNSANHDPNRSEVPLQSAALGAPDDATPAVVDNSIVSAPATAAGSADDFSAESRPQAQPATEAGRQASSPLADEPEARSTEPQQTAIAPPMSTLPSDPLDPIVQALASDPGPQGSANPSGAPTTTPNAPPAGGASSASDEDDAMPAGDELDGVNQARLVAHLQDKLPAIEFKDVPLGQFVAFLSEFSTVPIAIDSESLLEVGKGAKSKVSVKLAGGTVEQALRAALTRPGLSFHMAPGRIVITAGAAQR